MIICIEQNIKDCDNLAEAQQGYNAPYMSIPKQHLLMLTVWGMGFVYVHYELGNYNLFTTTLNSYCMADLA